MKSKVSDKNPEGNKLIAEFDGWTIEAGMEKESKPFYNKGINMFHVDNLQYHTSWDWLMLVVDKIEGLDLRISVVIKENKCGIYRHKGSPYEYQITKYEAATKIAATYLAIIEFINWHKDLTKTPQP
jgi:hypothetical protein